MAEVHGVHRSAVEGTQVPALQQSAPVWQLLLLQAHLPEWQFPDVQSLPFWQTAPMGPSAQLPAWQMPLQQSVLVPHGSNAL